MTRIKTDILVVGGGVAGLCATSAFANAGFKTLCVDPVPPVTTQNAEGADIRSTAFLLPAVELLKTADLWDRLAEHAAPPSHHAHRGCWRRYWRHPRASRF